VLHPRVDPSDETLALQEVRVVRHWKPLQSYNLTKWYDGALDKQALKAPRALLVATKGLEESVGTRQYLVSVIPWIAKSQASLLYLK
jgi:hypothetical protein